MHWKHQAQPSHFFILKDLVGDSSAVDKNQTEIVKHARLAVSLGKGIIIDLRTNNVRKHLYEDFWAIGFPFDFSQLAYHQRSTVA